MITAAVWTLTVWLFASPDLEATPHIVKRTFPTAALCIQEREHLTAQALAGGISGRIVLWCEEMPS
jgi:hypothetical protein